jgi:o-succinylbenzoate synthase
VIELHRITVREIHLPLVEPFQSAGGTVTARRILLLELTDRDGVSAWSECVAEATPSYSPDTVDTCWLAITEWLGPRVLGNSFATPREADAALQHGVRGHRMARAAIEMGCWALEATREGTPLAVMLAQSSAVAREQSTTPRLDVETGIALGMLEKPTDLARRAKAAVAEGYRRIKVKVGPGRDVGFLHAVRSAVGDAVALIADANSSYSLDDAEHVRALEVMDVFELAMIEQPLASDDLVRHAALQKKLQTPICLDESIVSAASTEDMIAMGSGRIVNLKPGRVGGFTEAIAIHDLCARATVPIWCGGMLESGIGRAYNVALASLPGFTLPGDLSPSARYWERDVVTPAWVMDASARLRVPLDRPGIGVDVDADFIGTLTVRSHTLDAQ